MNTLTNEHLHFVVTRLPKDLVKSMKKYKLIVAGGFIRELLSGGKINDIDVFGTNKETLENVARKLTKKRNGQFYKTDNAYTVLSNRWPIQFIHKWLFPDPSTCVESFDFTVCQAAIFYDGGKWCSVISDRFYSDLASKTLYYTAPLRDELVGGSLLRMIKFLKRGYNIQVDSVSSILGRIVTAVWETNDTTVPVEKVIAGLLREVDPLVVVDGILIDDHENISQ